MPWASTTARYLLLLSIRPALAKRMPENWSSDSPPRFLQDSELLYKLARIGIYKGNLDEIFIVQALALVLEKEVSAMFMGPGEIQEISRTISSAISPYTDSIILSDLWDSLYGKR